MGKVVVTSWNPGFQKVEANKLLRRRFGYSLDQAKYLVEDIVEKRPVHLTVMDEEVEQFCRELDALCAVYEVRKD
jgi:ribosomal protein L7/L12